MYVYPCARVSSAPSLTFEGLVPPALGGQWGGGVGPGRVTTDSGSCVSIGGPGVRSTGRSGTKVPGVGSSRVSYKVSAKRPPYHCPTKVPTSRCPRSRTLEPVESFRETKGHGGFFTREG